MRPQLVRLAALAVAVLLVMPAPAFAQGATPTALVGTPITASGPLGALSPNGRAILTLDRDAGLCVIDVATQRQRLCAELKTRGIRLDPTSVVWSPDSGAVAFAERPFTDLIDGDLWTMDAATGRLTDLTDDGFAGKLKIAGTDRDSMKGQNVFLDVLPAWSPDGQTIAFSRSAIIDGELRGNELVVVPASGGAVTTVATLTPQLIGVLFRGLAWTPDGQSLVYSYLGIDPKDPQNGVWIADVHGGAPRRLIASDPDLGRPIIEEIDATGTAALIFYVEAAARLNGSSDVYYWLLDVQSGARTALRSPGPSPEQAYIGGATFSPDGSKVLMISKLGDPDDSLVVHDRLSGHDDTVFSTPRLTLAGLGQGLNWANDGTVFTATNINAGFLVHLKTAAPPPPPATPGGELFATPAATGASGYVTGETVVTNDDANLRVSPSTDAAVAEPLARGSALKIVGVAVVADGFVWWPVIDPASLAIGWVRAEFLANRRS